MRKLKKDARFTGLVILSLAGQFVNLSKETKENIGGMIETALDTHSEFRDTDTGKPTGFSLSAAKFLKRYRSDAEYRNAVIDAVTNEAIKVAEEWKQKDE